MYFVQKNCTRFHNLGYTYFLNPSELKQVISKFKKGDYQTYYPYPSSEKNIIYKEDIPEVLLYEVCCNVELRHQDILGTMYSLNISPDLFGDVVLENGHYYIFILPIIQNYFETNFLMVKNARVELKEVPLSMLESFSRKYEDIELIVSSNRIDTILSSILHVGRGNVVDFIKKKEVLLNYEILKDLSYKLKEDDTFSIRKIGKYQYIGIVKATKSGHSIVRLKKYL